MALELVNVTPTGNDNRVILWERHEDHPEEGEAFISNDGKTRQVAKTPAVSILIGQGKLKEGGEVTPKTTQRAVEGSSTTNNTSTTLDNIAPPLRPATEAEEDAAGLTGKVEKQTAVVPERGKGR